MTEQNQESTISAPTSTEMDFEVSDTQIVEEVLNEATICEVENRNIGKNKSQQIGRIEDEATTHLRRYCDLIAKIAKIVRDAVNVKYPSAHILEFRTSLRPFSDGLNLLVLFDSIDLETDLHVGMVLSEIERDLFVDHKVFCEIAYIRKAKYIDNKVVNEKYPLVVKA
jgi:hypothetical protein